MPEERPMCTIEDRQGFFQLRPCSNHIVSQVVERGARCVPKTAIRHTFCAWLPDNRIVKIALLARSHIGDTAKVESPSKKPAPSTWYDAKCFFNKSIQISMEGSWPSDPKAKLPRWAETSKLCLFGGLYVRNQALIPEHSDTSSVYSVVLFELIPFHHARSHAAAFLSWCLPRELQRFSSIFFTFASMTVGTRRWK